MFKYQDATLPVRERVADLMSRMSLAEKVRQLGCTMQFGAGTDPARMDLAPGIGEIAVMGGAATPVETAAYIKMVQDYVMAHSPHSIPALFHCEALSGPMAASANLFPTSISLGATFDPEIVRDMSDRTRKQMLALGIRQALSPVLDVARDLRWGRVSETYGGDPTLNAAMSCAFVAGLQGGDIRDGIAATAKHFLGYAQTEGGINMAKTVADARDIREVFAKPFEAAIRKAGIKSVMNSYAELNGKPICASTEALCALLRDDLGFEGLVVSDYMSIPRLVRAFHTAADITDAGIQCLTAGLDVECPARDGYGDHFIAAAEQGLVAESLIDRSLERVLTLKFELGLFENPYPRTDTLAMVFDNTENDARSLAAARQAMTLTKNEGILPITDRQTRIAVIGPTGDSLRLMYSCYTYVASLEMFAGEAPPPDMAGLDLMDGPAMPQVTYVDMSKTDARVRAMYPGAKTIFEALGERFANTSYHLGCDYKLVDHVEIDEAVAAAAAADVVVLTVGGKNGWGLHCTTGEGIDASDLNLPGAQEALMRAVYAANPNLVIVHTDGRPLVSEWAYEHAAAILEAWLPCTFGGVAIAETLCGENVPGGRLPVDVPRTVGHTPIYHYQHHGSGMASLAAGGLNREGYTDSPASALRPFGYGLSYTTFAYSDFALAVDETGKVEARVTVANSGSVAGSEVVQLYGQDMVGSMIRPAAGADRLSADRAGAGRGAHRDVPLRPQPTRFHRRRRPLGGGGGRFPLFRGPATVPTFEQSPCSANRARSRSTIAGARSLPRLACSSPRYARVNVHQSPGWSRWTPAGGLPMSSTHLYDYGFPGAGHLRRWRCRI